MIPAEQRQSDYFGSLKLVKNVQNLSGSGAAINVVAKHHNAIDARYDAGEQRCKRRGTAVHVADECDFFGCQRITLGIVA